MHQHLAITLHTGRVEVGKKVFAKLSNKAKSIATKISLQRCVAPKQLMPNFNNLQIVPTENIVQSSTSNNKLHLSLANTRSLPSKGEELKYYITEKAIDVCAITESWIHKDATDESLKVVTPERLCNHIKTLSRWS